MAKITIKLSKKQQEDFEKERVRYRAVFNDLKTKVEDNNKQDEITKTVLDKMFNELLEDAYKTYQSEAYIKVIQQVAKQINGEKE